MRRSAKVCPAHVSGATLLQHFHVLSKILWNQFQAAPNGYQSHTASLLYTYFPESIDTPWQMAR